MSSSNGSANAWRRVKLGVVGDWGSGGTPERGVKSYYGGSIPWLKISDLNDGVVSMAEESITEEGLKNSSAKLVGPGSVLVAMYGSIGKLGLPLMVCATNQAIAFCKPSPDVASPEFLFHLLRSLRPALIAEGKGGNQSNISQTVLKALEVSIPATLDEQARIVRHLEAAGRHASSASTHISGARRAIAHFRQSVLAAACSGDLTRDWRRDRGVEDSADRPGGWVASRVSALAASVPRAIQSGPFGSNLLHSEFRSQGRLVIGIDNVLDGEFSMGREHRITEAKFNELTRYQARPLDVLITVMGTIGRVCVVPSDIEPAIITKHVYRITCDAERVDPHFLMHSLRGNPAVLAQIESQERGQTRPGLNGNIVKALVIDVPPIDEQHEILRRTASLLSLANDADGRISSAATAVDVSSRSMLMRVFNNM